MNIWKLLLSIFICVGIGSLSGFFTGGEIDTWYALQNKPDINPPNWLFAPVWTFLYILMGLSLYFFWNQKSIHKKTNGFIFFFIQLALNFIWSLLFFKLHSPLSAFIDIIFLILTIAVTMYFFFRVSSKSSFLLIPYLVWVCFATYLNFMIMTLN